MHRRSHFCDVISETVILAETEFRVVEGSIRREQFN